MVAGGTLDEPEIARRVAWSGAGLDLRAGSPSPSAVRRAVERVLAEPSFRTRAAAVGRSLGAHGGAEAAAELIERLATTRRPVLRSSDPWPAAGLRRWGPVLAPRRTRWARWARLAR